MVCKVYALWATIPVLADRGAIITEHVDLQEPAQRAIIAHNGTWEVMILQTDVKSDKPTKVVEFMPLPSIPEVSIVQDTCFDNLQKIIDRHNLQYIVEFANRSIDGSSEKSERIKIVAKHEIGPHNVTVVKIDDVNEFESWVRNFFKDNSLGQPILLSELKKTVEDYFQRSFHFLAFDVIDIPRGQKTVAPLAYQFKCDHIYYPLKVTNLYGGKGKVEIFYVLNPWCDPNACGPDPFDFYSQEKAAKKWIFTRKVAITPKELATLHPAINKLFQDANAYLFATKFDGELRFNDDIWLKMQYASPTYISKRFLSYLQENDIDSMENLICVPFALNRQEYRDTNKLLDAFRDFTKKGNLKDFRLTSAGSFGPGWSNEFDKTFIETYLKGKRWDDYYLDSGNQRLHFFVINYNPEGLNNFKVMGFRIGPSSDN